MTQQYENTNRGALFRNNRKEQDNHPDHNGSINIDGKEYWLSAWIKESKNGSKFFSLSVKPKDENQSQTTSPAKDSSSSHDGDIPF